MWITLLTALLLSVSSQDLLVRNASVLDPDGDGWRHEMDVFVEDGRILAIGSELQDRDAVIIEAEGLWLVPGLIDLHSHLLLHPYNETSWNDQVLKESLELRTVRGVAAMKATLEAGFTTLRELGTEGAAYADVALRDSVRLGIVPGPRVLAATRALVATGCYGPSGFDPRWELPKGAQVADGVDGVRIAVRQQIAAGADWIKVYADYRRKPGDPSTPTYSLAELVAIVDEARSAGLPVAAHASTDEAMQRAVIAGCKTIEHGTHGSLATLRLMKREGVVLCPTLAAADAIARYTGWDGEDPNHPRIKDSRDLMKRALEAGVTITCGSDVGVFPHGDNALELELMAQYGMSPAEVLRSATRTAAEVIGMGDRLGRVAPGFIADLVLLRADPLIDASATRRVAVVVQAGRVVHERKP